MKLFLNKKLAITLSLVFLFGSGTGFYFNSIIKNSVAPAVAEDLRLDDQEATVRAIKKVMPAVVSIIVYDYKESLIINLNTGKQSAEKEKAQTAVRQYCLVLRLKKPGWRKGT